MYRKEQGILLRTCWPGGVFSCQTKRAVSFPLSPLSAMGGVFRGFSSPLPLIKNNLFYLPRIGPKIL